MLALTFSLIINPPPSRQPSTGSLGAWSSRTWTARENPGHDSILSTCKHFRNAISANCMSLVSRNAVPRGNLYNTEKTSKPRKGTPRKEVDSNPCHHELVRQHSCPQTDTVSKLNICKLWALYNHWTNMSLFEWSKQVFFNPTLGDTEVVPIFAPPQHPAHLHQVYSWFFGWGTLGDEREQKCAENWVEKRWCKVNQQ